MASYFSRLFPDINFEVVAFGAPLVGDQDFTADFNKRVNSRHVIYLGEGTLADDVYTVGQSPKGGGGGGKEGPLYYFMMNIYLYLFYVKNIYILKHSGYPAGQRLIYFYIYIFFDVSVFRLIETDGCWCDISIHVQECCSSPPSGDAIPQFTCGSIPACSFLKTRGGELRGPQVIWTLNS